MLRILCFGISLFFSTTAFSQEYALNDYKYIVVPEAYSFSIKKDAYQLNSLTKFLFKKHGFNVFSSTEDFPKDFEKNRCKVLEVTLKKKSDFFSTKLSVQLTDCNGKIVFTSSEGKSKEKEYKRAYQEALRNTFVDVRLKNYTYNGKSDDDTAIHLDPISNSSIQEIETETAIIVEVTQTYVFNNEQFIFSKQSYGFEVIRDSVPIGKLIKATRDNTYIVQAGDLSGYGYFDTAMNFVIERVLLDTGELTTNVFVVKN